VFELLVAYEDTFTYTYTFLQNIESCSSLWRPKQGRGTLCVACTHKHTYTHTLSYAHITMHLHAANGKLEMEGCSAMQAGQTKWKAFVSYAMLCDRTKVI